MSDYIPYILFILGFVMIIKGSDWFVDSVIWIAKVLKIPNIIIGATLVSICTTLPETMVSVSSALRNNTDMALGNALGSIAVNTGFIFATAIIFMQPVLKNVKGYRRNAFFLLTLIAGVYFMGYFTGSINRYTGIFLLILLVLYLYKNIQDFKKDSSTDTDETAPSKTSADKRRNILFFLIGLALTIGGSNLLVVNGEIIARMLGVSEIIIGLTMTAVGTSLPELVTAVAAIVKKAHGISVGNILGANILNILLVIGLSSVITPIAVKDEMLGFHIPYIFGIVAIMTGISFFGKGRLKRGGGILLMLSYSIYIALTFTIFKG